MEYHNYAAIKHSKRKLKGLGNGDDGDELGFSQSFRLFDSRRSIARKVVRCYGVRGVNSS